MDDATVISKIKSDLTWLQKHERIVLAVVVALAIWFGIGKIDTLIANHDHANLTQAQIADGVQADKNAATAALALQQADAFEKLAAQESLDKQVLTQRNVVLEAELAAQQKTDATLPPTELVARLNTLVPTAQAAVTPAGIALPETGAVATVQQLEIIPVQQKQIENETAIAAGTQKLLDASESRVSTLNTEIAGLNTKSVDDAKVCKDQIAVVKADARKSKRKWFVAGFATGLSVRGAVKIFFGI